MATHLALPPPRGHSDYLSSGEYTDVTIHFDGQSLRAHRIVLAMGSDYFATLFNSAFKEARTCDISLSDDSPGSVLPMIAHLYGKPVEFGIVKSTDAGFQQVVMLIDLYITANKYLVSGLCTKIEQVFPVNLMQLFHHGSYPTHVDAIVRIVYKNHTIVTEKLQDLTATLLLKRIRELSEYRDFKRLMMELPELAYTMLVKLALPKNKPLAKKRRNLAD